MTELRLIRGGGVTRVRVEGPRPQLVHVMFCCNDPDNGACQEWTNDVHFGLEGESDTILELNGSAVVVRHFTLSDGHRYRLRFGRLLLRCGGLVNWVGNWCWDSTWVTQKTAVRMVRYLLDRKWQPQSMSVGESGNPFMRLRGLREYMRI